MCARPDRLSIQPGCSNSAIKSNHSSPSTFRIEARSPKIFQWKKGAVQRGSCGFLSCEFRKRFAIDNGRLIKRRSTMAAGGVRMPPRSANDHPASTASITDRDVTQDCTAVSAIPPAIQSSSVPSRALTRLSSTALKLNILVLVWHTR
jgi:hypothetical protein